MSVEQFAYDLGSGGGASFDQDLNTSDDVTFASVALGGASEGDLLTSGGSVSASGAQVGDWLAMVLQPGQPTVQQALAAHPEIVFAWQATTDPSYGADVVVFVHGGSWLFFAEVGTGDLTGGSEPTWADADDPGETVNDGDVTWVNAGLWSAWPPTPETWQANHAYTNPAFVWPTTPNGHVYVAYPPSITTGGSEPTFPTTFGTYVSDGTSYWQDVGGLVSPVFASTFHQDDGVFAFGANNDLDEISLRPISPNVNLIIGQDVITGAGEGGGIDLSGVSSSVLNGGSIAIYGGDSSANTHAAGSIFLVTGVGSGGASHGDIGLQTSGNISINGTPGVTAGPFTTITSITVTKGIITDLQGS